MFQKLFVTALRRLLFLFFIRYLFIMVKWGELNLHIILHWWRMSNDAVLQIQFSPLYESNVLFFIYLYAHFPLNAMIYLWMSLTGGVCNTLSA